MSEQNEVRDGIIGALTGLAGAITIIATWIKRRGKRVDTERINGTQVLNEGFRELGHQQAGALTMERTARMEAEQRARQCEADKMGLITEIADLRAEIRILRSDLQDLQDELTALKGRLKENS